MTDTDQREQDRTANMEVSLCASMASGIHSHLLRKRKEETGRPRKEAKTPKAPRLGH